MESDPPFIKLIKSGKLDAIPLEESGTSFSVDLPPFKPVVYYDHLELVDCDEDMKTKIHHIIDQILLVFLLIDEDSFNVEELRKQSAEMYKIVEQYDFAHHSDDNNLFINLIVRFILTLKPEKFERLSKN